MKDNVTNPIPRRTRVAGDTIVTDYKPYCVLESQRKCGTSTGKAGEGQSRNKPTQPWAGNL